jgi:hypothetical protein
VYRRSRTVLSPWAASALTAGPIRRPRWPKPSPIGPKSAEYGSWTKDGIWLQYRRNGRFTGCGSIDSHARGRRFETRRAHTPIAFIHAESDAAPELQSGRATLWPRRSVVTPTDRSCALVWAPLGGRFRRAAARDTRLATGLVQVFPKWLVDPRRRVTIARTPAFRLLRKR